MTGFVVVPDVDVAADGYGFVGFWMAYDEAGVEVARGRCTVAASTRDAALAAARRQALAALKER